MRSSSLFSKSRILALTALIVIVGFYFFSDLDHILSIQSLRQEQTLLKGILHNHPVAMTAICGVLYTVASAFVIPGTGAMTVGVGALFGMWNGFWFSTIFGMIGTVLGFVLARHALRGLAERKFPSQIAKVDKEMCGDGALYLFALRSSPVLPFFLMNFVLGVTRIRLRTFTLVSFLAMVPTNLAYLNAGTQLSRVRTFSGLLSPQVTVAFTIVGLLPLLCKWVLRHFGGEHVSTEEPSIRFS